MKLEGTLDTFPLRELVEMIAYSSVTGALNVYGPDSIGHLYFRDGQLYHADCDAQRGLDALVSMLEYERGLFAFVSDQTVGEETFWGNYETHVHTAERLARRWRQVRAYVPNLDLIPQLAIPRDGAMRRAGPAHFPLIEAINDGANLRAIAQTLSWAEIDLAEAFAQLSVDGIVELRRSADRPSSGGGTTGEGRIFDRFLARAGVAPAAAPTVANPAQPSRAAPADDPILRLLRG